MIDVSMLLGLLSLGIAYLIYQESGARIQDQTISTVVAGLGFVFITLAIHLNSITHPVSW